MVLKRFFRMDLEQATRVMLHVHQKGVGVCGVFPYEIAETKVNQVMDFARAEPAPAAMHAGEGLKSRDLSHRARTVTAHDRAELRRYSAALPRQRYRPRRLSKFLTAIDRYILRLVLVPMLGGVRARGVAADARQDAAAVRFRRDRGRPGRRRVQDAGQPAARICQPGDPARADARHPARLPQAGDLERARRDARGRAGLHPAAAGALSDHRWCWWRSTWRSSAISSRSARYYYEQLEFELRSGALGASIKVGEFTTLKDRMALRIERERGRRARADGHLRPRRRQQGPGAVDLGARGARSSPTATIPTRSSCA